MSDLKTQIAQRRQSYGQKKLGNFNNQKPLHNNADHPDHANYDMVDHMRASAIHSKMAEEKEQAGQYPESAHHREQSVKHKAAWKSMAPKSPFIKSEQIMDATSRSGQNPTKSTLNTGEETAVEEKIEKEADSDELEARRQKKLADAGYTNALRLIEAVKKVVNNGAASKGEPPYIDDGFKQKLQDLKKNVLIFKKPQKQIKNPGKAVTLPNEYDMSEGPDAEFGEDFYKLKGHPKLKDVGSKDPRFLNMVIREMKKVNDTFGETTEGSTVNQNHESYMHELGEALAKRHHHFPDSFFESDKTFNPTHMAGFLDKHVNAIKDEIGNDPDPESMLYRYVRPYHQEYLQNIDGKLKETQRKKFSLVKAMRSRMIKSQGAQYAKTGDPEDRKKALKEGRLQDKKKKEIAKDIKADTIKFIQHQRGIRTGGSKAFPATPKKTLRGIKDIDGGEQINKPEKTGK